MMLEPREAAMRRAGTALARRARSEAELARTLALVAPPDVVEGVLADLRSLGYLDDSALACSLAERRLASGWGSLRVRGRPRATRDRGRRRPRRDRAAEAGERAAAERLLELRAPPGRRRAARPLLARRGFSERT